MTQNSIDELRAGLEKAEEVTRERNCREDPSAADEVADACARRPGETGPDGAERSQNASGIRSPRHLAPGRDWREETPETTLIRGLGTIIVKLEKTLKAADNDSEDAEDGSDVDGRDDLPTGFLEQLRSDVGPSLESPCESPRLNWRQHAPPLREAQATISHPCAPTERYSQQLPNEEDTRSSSDLGTHESPGEPRALWQEPEVTAPEDPVIRLNSQTCGGQLHEVPRRDSLSHRSSGGSQSLPTPASHHLRNDFATMTQEAEWAQLHAQVAAFIQQSAHVPESTAGARVTNDVTVLQGQFPTQEVCSPPGPDVGGASQQSGDAHLSQMPGELQAAQGSSERPEDFLLKELHLADDAVPGDSLSPGSPLHAQADAQSLEDLIAAQKTAAPLQAEALDSNVEADAREETTFDLSRLRPAEVTHVSPHPVDSPAGPQSPLQFQTPLTHPAYYERGRGPSQLEPGEEYTGYSSSSPFWRLHASRSPDGQPLVVSLADLKKSMYGEVKDAEDWEIRRGQLFGSPPQKAWTKSWEQAAAQCPKGGLGGLLLLGLRQAGVAVISVSCAAALAIEVAWRLGPEPEWFV